MTATNGLPPLVRVWSATLIEADLRWRRWLSDPELHRLSRFESAGDQARYLLAAAMVRSAAGIELGVLPHEVVVDRTCLTCGGWHGRPTVPGSDLVLSVTHSGLVVALALARGVDVGVDVERVRHGDEATAAVWTCAEARFKAGNSPELVVRQLAAPRRGYVLSVATRFDAVVHVRRSGEVLTHLGGLDP